MPKLLVIAAISLVPLAAFADDAHAPSVEINIYNNAPASAPTPPPVEPVEAAPVITPIVAPIVAPVEAPIVAPGVAPVVVAPAPQVDADPCARGWWRGRYAGKRRGFLGIGFAKGHMELEDETEGKTKSFIARAQGRRGFGIELELARGELGADESKTVGGSLFKAFGKRRLMPYVIAGGGRGVIEREGGGEDRMRYMEAGGGLMLKLRRFAIGVDMRRGVRRVDEAEAVAPVTMDGAAPSVVTPTDEDDRAKYVRGRVMALVTF
ncbi:MAG TPA: hypothetical protein VIV11_27205 [Kofleriaceae bacterium]